MTPATNPMDLGGSTVLVTGASGGIGRATAILLSELNAKLVLSGRHRGRLEETLAGLNGAGHAIEEFDLERVEEIPEWMKSLARAHGPLNAAVHAAGKRFVAPVRFLAAHTAQETLRVNLESAIMLARGFSQKGCHASESALVFISSITAIVGSPAIAAYAASKSGLVGLTRSLAVEMANDRLRVNCVAPAMVETEMLEELRETLSPAQFESLEHAHPLGFGTPRDVAAAVAFLVAKTGRWITGTTLVVDGGYSAQ